MTLNLDDEELDRLLPMRAGLPLGDFLSATFLEGAETLLLPSLETLGLQPGLSAMVFSDDPDDSGTRCRMHHLEPEEIVLERNGDCAGSSQSYQKTLLFLLARPWLLGFFASWKTCSEPWLRFSRPARILRRTTRSYPRIRVNGTILLHRRQGEVLKGTLYDFSPGGASFYCDIGEFTKGDLLLAEFVVPDCGNCETLVTIARQEVLTNSRWRYLVGVHYNLTGEQRQKLERIYQCKMDGLAVP